MTKPYELRLQEGGRPSEAVGMIDLTIKAKTKDARIIQLPQDKEFREETKARAAKKSEAGDELLTSKASEALARLRAINE